MRISEHDEVLTISDRPAALWLIGLWFVAGGAFAMLMVFLASNAHELAWWERMLAFAIGAGCLAGGLYTLRGAPSRLTVLNRRANRGWMRIQGVRMREELAFRCSDVVVVEMREEKDSDGDPCWQLRLGLRTGGVLPLHSMHRHGREWCEERRERICAFLGLPRAAPGGEAH